MKLVWCPEMASKAYIDGVRALAAHNDLTGSTEVAELVAAMAGGWNAQLVVEAPGVSSAQPSSSSSPPPATSVALAAAARRTGGRYASVLPEGDVDSTSAPAVYAGFVGPEEDADAGAESQTVVVGGDADEAMAQLEDVNLLVIDARRQDEAAVLRAARPGARGMLVVRHGDGWPRGGTPLATASSMAAGTRLVRSVYLPIGIGKGPSHLHSRCGRKGNGRWIRHVNHDTGEEHVFRRQ
ncbi:uncharacterized protein LOC120675196 [Panicum virgatum]|uniref:Uncharacterized protein n=1 Tax=Panicum virgatum TaxID=38727 RepID=A0A8T0RTV3_PANVG|nr:uncharacterized protein LOC120675196 [Panicum virgatum]KAG2589387.1 hypothetical protein PVAP13_5NG237800 [Panicum virgatum]